MSMSFLGVFWEFYFGVLFWSAEAMLQPLSITFHRLKTELSGKLIESSWL